MSQKRMKPSHIYQPVLIRALVEAGGKATLRQLAQVFVSQDESQLQFYERRTHPVAPGHHLVIPKRHTADYFSMTEDERRDATDLLRVLRKKILDDDTSVVGFNVGMNCGEATGQTVMHAHVDLIPRRKGDTPQPRGGVRGMIPARMSY